MNVQIHKERQKKELSSELMFLMVVGYLFVYLITCKYTLHVEKSA